MQQQLCQEIHPPMGARSASTLPHLPENVDEHHKRQKHDNEVEHSTLHIVGSPDQDGRVHHRPRVLTNGGHDHKSLLADRSCNKALARMHKERKKERMTPFRKWLLKE